MKKMLRHFARVATFMIAVSALPALAQGPAPGGPPKPAPELGQLAFFAGDWSCKGKAEASPFGPEHATVGSVHVSREIGGFWYVGRYSEKKTAVNPQPMVFHFLQGYDAAAKNYLMDCFDAFGSHCHQTSAGWQDGKLIYSGEATGGGPATPVRDTFTKTGANEPGAHGRDAGRGQVDGDRSRDLRAGEEVDRDRASRLY